MSIIFGIHSIGGATVQFSDLLLLSRATERWAPDGVFLDIDETVGMGFQPYFTHARSRLAKKPIRDAFGNMAVLDGRLDNHSELRSLLGIRDADASDGEIILAAFQRWREQSFSKFIGDWALALWSAKEQQLYLTRDHAGSRPLYFIQNRDGIRWSSYLDTLVCGQGEFALEERYLARYLHARPQGDLTPYRSLFAVAPGHAVAIHGMERRTFQHWSWLPERILRYRDDSEYEEQFLTLLQQSIQRRTGPGAAILAQLSGGIDSSTIVCASDALQLAQGEPIDSLLDTVSFYDDTEPNWNERPYFTAIEEHRGKRGIHVDVSRARPTFCAPTASFPALLPGLDSGAEEQRDVLEGLLAERDYRVVLSGIGGDELLGGVPTPLPELSDRMIVGDIRGLLKSAVSWGLANRQPLVHLLWDAAAFSIDPLGAVTNHQRGGALPWISQNLSNCDTLDSASDHGPRSNRRAPLPSSLATSYTCRSLIETLPNPQLALGVRREYRFPYLDRDLVAFLLCVPSEQLVRPGRRRSLMRRAVKGIVPELVLERKRKAYISRKTSLSIRDQAHTIREIVRASVLAKHGYISRDSLLLALDEVIADRRSEWAPALIRTCLFEIWLGSRPPLALSS